MRLYVNIDHVATVREARRTDEPDPVAAAAAAERAGADGITVHLREDRRHIQDADVRALRAAVRTVLNLELGAASEIVQIARRLKPYQATLVPERRQEITTEGGLALGGARGRGGASRKIRGAIEQLTNAGVRVSLFIDPDLRTIDRAAALGVTAVELHTGRYAHTWRTSDAALRALRRAAAHARARVAGQRAHGEPAGDCPGRRGAGGAVARGARRAADVGCPDETVGRAQRGRPEDLRAAGGQLDRRPHGESRGPGAGAGAARGAAIGAGPRGRGVGARCGGAGVRGARGRGHRERARSRPPGVAHPPPSAGSAPARPAHTAAVARPRRSRRPPAPPRPARRN